MTRRITKHQLVRLAFFLVALLLTFLAGKSIGAPAKLPPGAPPSDGTPVVVTHVSDGDTFSASHDGHEFTVRVLGIDTPETVKPNAPVDCYGPEASAATTHMLDGATVTLSADPSQDDRDRYGRYLRFVALPDGSDLGATLVSAGYAFEYTFSSPSQNAMTYRALEDEAVAAHRGLWGACPNATRKQKR